MIKKLIDQALDNSFIVVLNGLLLAAFGLWAVSRLPIDVSPDVTNVQVQVLTTAPALGPEEVEQFITFPVESSLSGLPRVEEIRSVSQFGLSAVTIVFEEGVDIYWARQLVGERLIMARTKIPPGMGVPEMGPVTTGLGEIFQFEVRAKPGYEKRRPLMRLREELDWNIAYKLRGVPGVIEVNTFGGELKTYEVAIDPRKLLNYGISIDRLLQALERNNGNEGGGYIVHGQEQRIVRGEGLISSLGEIGDIVLDERADGAPIFVKDVGEVRFAPMLRQGAVTRDGRGEGVVGIVMLLMGENARVVVDRVKTKIAEIERTLPEGVYIDPFYDRTELVRRTIFTVVKNLAEGGALVIVVLFLLLGSLRAGLVVALAVPLSMLGAFIGMWLTGLSGNLMSLGAIDFGLIVDGSVVLIENIVRRAAERQKLHGGEIDAALIRRACHEVARPVTFGVGIIVIVYLPILSLQGMEGKMFRPMAFTVIFALITSLVLALTLMPVLGTLFLRRGVSEHETFLVRLAKRIYEPLLACALRRPWHTLGLAGLAFAASVALALRLGAVFIPKLDEGSIAVQAVRLPSVSLEASIAMTGEIEKTLLEFPEVASVVSKTGRPEIANDPMTVNLTDIFISLTPEGEWAQGRTKESLVLDLEKALNERVPSNGFSFTQPIELRVQELVAGVRSDVGLSLFGDSLEDLAATAERIAETLMTVPGNADVQVEQTKGLPFLRVRVKRQEMARYGINARDVLDAIAAVGGKVVGQVFEGQRRFPLQVRFDPRYRLDVEKLRQINVSDRHDRQIPLEQLVELQEVEGPAQISRSGLQRRILIQCNVRGRDLAGFVADARRAVETRVQLPSGYYLTWGGQFQNLQEASARLTIAVPAALFLIFAILHVTFDSFKLAGLIFLNVPMAVTGGVIALAARGMPFSISAGVGFIALFGVAVLNGVVLVTYIVELRREGQSLHDAARNGALIRMRPVLMTALVATLGFVPMAVATSAGAEVQRPLATVVIGGLITSSLLTLFVLPAIYGWFEPRGLTSAAGAGEVA